MIDQLIEKADQAFFKYVFKPDALLLLSVTLVMVYARNVMYPQEIIDVYYGNNKGPFSLAWFCVVYKILMNKFLFKERSIHRNMFFDLFRCLLYPFVMETLVFSGPEAFTANAELVIKRLVSQGVAILVLSYTLNKTVSKRWFERYPVVWALLSIEYTTLFGTSLVKHFNNYEAILEGNTIMISVIFFSFVHYSWLWFFIEEYFFEDMHINNHFGTLQQVLDNIGLYSSYFIIIPLVLFAQWWYHGKVFRDDFLAGDVTKLPFEFHQVHFHNLTSDAHSGSCAYARVVFHLSSVVFSLNALYYQLKFLHGVRDSKKKLKSN